MIQYSIIVPIFKREDEVKELIDSLHAQPFADFELILVDGSPSNDLVVVDEYARGLSLKYAYQRVYKKGLGISASRNLGASLAKGTYLIFMDSDVWVPENYFAALPATIEKEQPDVFGGPDAAHVSFSVVQKAISFSMTSMLTTGGIRGKANHVGKFKPRGFNMGLRASLFKELKGYDVTLPVGEDMDLSARAIASGAKVMLIPDAFVYHKRRVSIKKFYNQVFRFGAARVMLSRMHEGELKVTHLFPLFFAWYVTAGVFVPFLGVPFLMLWPGSIAGYLFLIFLSSTVANRSIAVGVTSIATTLTQFFGYAMGFMANTKAVWLQGKENGIFEKKEGEPESPL